MSCQGKIVTTGLGKSGFISRKLASTFASTGTAAIFLHPTEALHGDFGMLQKGDVLIAIAFGGETREVLAVCKFANRQNIPVIAITGKLESTLSQLADVVIDGSVDREADFLGLAPTASSTLALALGDSLAVAVMRSRGFTKEDFAALHPGGSLGFRLVCISEIMIKREKLNCVFPHSDFHQVLNAVTNPNYGICPVIGSNDEIIGAITDGDLRRALLASGDRALKFTAVDLMNSKPKLIDGGSRATDAITVMEKSKITSLFVTSGSAGKLLGLVRLHDLLSEKII
jgi:arabinose-5-phosphate isomerase